MEISAATLQGDHSGSSQPPVDFKTKVVFQFYTTGLPAYSDIAYGDILLTVTVSLY